MKTTIKSRFLAFVLLLLVGANSFAGDGIFINPQLPDSGGTGGSGGGLTLEGGTSVGDWLRLTDTNEIGSVNAGNAESIAVWSGPNTLTANTLFTRSNATGVVTNTVGFKTSTTPATFNLYVDPGTGSDLNPCTVSSPCATIEHTLTQAPIVSGGDVTINLADATYAEEVMVRETIGNAANSSYGQSVIRFVGDTATPANVVIQSSTFGFNIMNSRTTLVLDGLTIDASAGNSGIIAFNGVFYLGAVDIVAPIGIQMNEGARGFWSTSAAGGTITATNIGLSMSRSSSFSINTPITITGFTGSGISISQNALLGASSSAAPINLIGNGAQVGINISTGANFTSSTNALNISNVNAGGTGYALRVIDNGRFNLNQGATITIDDCSYAGQISSNSFFRDGTTGNTWNYTGTTPAEWHVSGDVSIISPASFSGAQVASNSNTGNILGNFWNQQRTINSNTTLIATDHEVLLNPAGTFTVTLPEVTSVGVGRRFRLTDISGTAATNNVTVARSGSDTINGATSFTIGQDYASYEFVSRASGWNVESGISYNGPSGSGSAGQVAYWTGASTQGGNAHFTWNDTDALLTLGTSGVNASGITLASDLISQPVTDLIPITTAGGAIQLDDPEDGGIAVAGISTVGGNSPTKFFGINGDSGTITRAGFEFTAAKSDGGTNITALAATEPVMAVNNESTEIFSLLGDGSLALGTNNPPTQRLDVGGNALVRGRILGQTAAVTAANDLVLGTANVNIVSGNTQINAISTVGWTAGSQATLIFTGTPTVKHNTAGGASTAVMLLDGSTDLVAANNTVLTLVYDGTSWQQSSLKAP